MDNETERIRRESREIPRRLNAPQIQRLLAPIQRRLEYARSVRGEWNKLVRPVLCKEIEEEDDHPDAAAGNSNYAVDSYKEALAKLMLRYALRRSSFHEEVRRERDRDTELCPLFPSDPNTIEKMAFFRYFSQINHENALKSQEYKQMRLEEWQQFKEQKKIEMANKPITELEELLEVEKSKRTKEDQKKWKKDQRALRSIYLQGREDYVFEDGFERPIDRNNSSS